MNFFFKHIYYLLVYLLLFATEVKSQLMIDTTATKEQLVEMLVDKGVYYDNVRLSCPGISKGIFSHPTDQSNLPLGEGIILTTGKAINAMGPNTGGARSGKNSISVEDVDLIQLADEGSAVEDRCILEFDITPVGNEITFNYVFGSEEYPDYVGSQYNDVFGFFVSGPGIKGPFERNAANIAVVGGIKKLPVSVNTINSGVISSKYKRKFRNLFRKSAKFSHLSHLYNDNSKYHPLSIQYNGFTKSLEAKIKVVPCERYHFKLAIADVGDGVIDSGVFIEENSFKSNNYYADKISTFSTCENECTGSVMLNILDGKPNNYNISWVFENGETIEGSLIQENLCPGTNITAIVQPENGGCRQMLNIKIPDLLSVGGISTGSTSWKSCNGQIALNVSGGVPPYSYSWSNGKKEKDLIDVCAGEYLVTVKDANQCQITLPFEVTDEEVKKVTPMIEPTRGLNNKATKPKQVNKAKKELERLVKRKSMLTFDKNDFNIQEKDFPYLERVASILKKDTNLKVRIVGHASSEGTEAYNMTISEIRAEQVMDYLLIAGVSETQIEIFAKGEENLYRDEKSEEDRMRNRRVEIMIKD